jgi:hypothetical protein
MTYNFTYSGSIETPSKNLTEEQKATELEALFDVGEISFDLPDTITEVVINDIWECSSQE